MTAKTDRELLELAAKAAGFAVTGWYGSDPGDFWLQLEPRPDPEATGWNPLTDDGDALRLAVKLGIDVLHESLDEPPHVPTHVKAQSWNLEAAASEALWEDPCAATRRAIVRAAAAIGEANP